MARHATERQVYCQKDRRPIVANGDIANRSHLSIRVCKMSASFEAYSIEYAILCDQVRREDNGKRIAIGIYGRNILLQQFPAKLALSLFMLMRPKKTGLTKIEFRALLDDTVVATFGGEIAISDLNVDHVDTPPTIISLAHAGKLEFHMRSKETEPWQPILSVIAESAPTS